MHPNTKPLADLRPASNFSLLSIPLQPPLHVRIWRGILMALHESRSKEARRVIR